MAAARHGEAPNPEHTRSARVYTTNSVWWFDTREGVQFGPFIYKTAARCALAVYLAQHLHETAPEQHPSSTASGEQDGITHMVEEVRDVLKQHSDYGARAAITWAESRLEQLRSSGTLTADIVGRIRALEFSLRHPEQTFDFEYFLKCRVG